MEARQLRDNLLISSTAEIPKVVKEMGEGNGQHKQHINRSFAIASKHYDGEPVSAVSEGASIRQDARSHARLPGEQCRGTMRRRIATG